MQSYVTLQVVGFHNWPDAPAHLEYLRARHRHVFHAKVTFPQPSDRAIEFHQFQRLALRTLWNMGETSEPYGVDYGSHSCETIARVLGHLLLEACPGPDWIEVDVSEDGECGSIVRTVRR
jgi:hypothetical protein